MVPQRIGRRVPGLSAAHIYELAKAGLRRFVSRFGGIKGFVGRDFRRGGRALGEKGEKLAARRLRRDGYWIIKRNFRAAGAELDLVALDGDTLVFIEVKTRLSSSAGRPEDSVHELKQHRIRRAAAVFARVKRMEEWPMRFDVVAVSRPHRRWRIEIIKDAF